MYRVFGKSCEFGGWIGVVEGGECLDFLWKGRSWKDNLVFLDGEVRILEIY